MKKEYQIDRSAFDTFQGFVTHFNVFVLQENCWNGNLDAFDDIHCGGFGTLKEGFIITWRNSEKSRRDLGHEAMVQ
jgi:hypothetical protein